ncbi:hypothetical protein HaLaN_32850 [Haematococcus lacustris]|uniref:Uncharacterized protein n=1 Tax=Haematococcus lacustris TaxID=44745 RepID=A0A6A0AMI9_HAELA|nr:hypothetical protein HaLaN_32850 [Haematococcus lacustris]
MADAAGVALEQKKACHVHHGAVNPPERRPQEGVERLEHEALEAIEAQVLADALEVHHTAAAEVEH